MACEIKVMSAIVDKVKELSESGLNSSIEDANRIANDVNDAFKEDVVKFIPRKKDNVLSEIKKSIDSIQSGELTSVSFETSNYIYDNLSEDALGLLFKSGIDKSNFMDSFNNELLVVNKSSWFQKIIDELVRIFKGESLKSIVKSIKADDITSELSDEANLLIHGITAKRKSKIPAINKLMYRFVVPYGYNAPIVLKKGMVTMFTGRSFNDFADVINQYEVKIEEDKGNIGHKPKRGSELTEEQFNKREDSWRLSNGLPQLHNTYKYVGTGFLQENGEVIFDESGEDVYEINNPNFQKERIDNLKNVDVDNFIMGTFGFKVGIDDNGHYIQYSDKWDFNTGNKIANSVLNATQNPFLIVGKIYKALTYDENNEPYFYYTYDADNADIKAHSEFISYIDSMDVANESSDYQNLNECFI